MPTWTFRPAPQRASADTADLAFDFGLYIVNSLEITHSTATLVRYEGALSFGPDVYSLGLTGTGFGFDGRDITAGTITRIDLSIGGATHVTATGLDFSAVRFDDLAIPDFASTVLLERLMFSGRDVITGTRNDDDIGGFAGADRIFGGLGSDELDGGDGNDRLIGGGAFDDLIGGAGNDRLAGGQGSDELTGGGGADRFIFDVSVFQNGTDSITDFSRRNDILVIDNDDYRGIGRAGDLAASKFKNIDTGTLDGGDRFFYSQTNGTLFYDADGSGFRREVLIATFDNNIRLTADDFLIAN